METSVSQQPMGADEAEFWAGYSFKQLSRYSRSRSLCPLVIRSYKAGVTTEAEQQKLCRVLCEALSSWYSEWGTFSYPPPPDLMDEEQIVEAAEAAGIDTSSLSTQSGDIHVVKAKLMEHHINVRKTYLQEQLPISDGEESEGAIVQSHPGGCAYSVSTGNIRLNFPDGTVAPEEVTGWYGRVLLRHHILDGKVLQQEHKVITGLTGDSSPNCVIFEIVSLSTGRKSHVKASEVADYITVDSWESGFAKTRNAVQLLSDLEHYEVPFGWANQSAAHRPSFMTFLALHVLIELDSSSSFRTTPKSLGPDGKAFCETSLSELMERNPGISWPPGSSGHLEPQNNDPQLIPTAPPIIPAAPPSIPAAATLPIPTPATQGAAAPSGTPAAAISTPAGAQPFAPAGGVASPSAAAASAALYGGGNNSRAAATGGDSYDILIGAPKNQTVKIDVQSSDVGSLQSPLHTVSHRPGASKRQNELESLKEYLTNCYNDVACGHARINEEYDQPKDTNLYTGAPLNANQTHAERLDTLIQEYGEPKDGDAVNPWCVACTARNIEIALREVPGFNANKLDDFMQIVAFLDDPEAEGCPEHHNDDEEGTDSASEAWCQPACPSLWAPTRCPFRDCRQLVFCAGKLPSGCTKCRRSYLFPSPNKSNAPVGVRSSEAIQKEQENTHFQYLRMIGGTSRLMGSARTTLESRTKMVPKMKSLLQTSKEYQFTWRHALYGPNLVFASFPDGRDGLCARDFIPTMGVADVLLNGSEFIDGAENMDFTALDDDPWAGGPDDLDTKSLQKHVQKNSMCAPEWPSISCDSTDPRKVAEAYVMQRSMLSQALDLMGSFVVDHGGNMESDKDKTNAALKQGATGTRGDALPMFEHRIVCAYHTFYSRSKDQAADFSESKLYKFESDKGWSIRLFYSPTMPMVLEQIQMPAERKQRQQTIHSLYDGKFNAGGLGLSRTSGAPGEAAPKKQRNRKSKGTSQCAGIMQRSQEANFDEPIILLPGTLCGDRLPRPSKHKALSTFRADGRRYCTAYQAGCCNHGTVKCCDLHEYTLQHAPAQTRIILSLGGHKLWPELTINKLLPLLPTHFKQLNRDRSTACMHQQAVRLVDKTLEKVERPMGEKRPLNSITDRLVSSQSFTIMGSNSPFPVYTCSGVEAQRVTMKTVGQGNAFFDGNQFHNSGRIELANGDVLENLCAAIAPASVKRLDRCFENRPGASIELESARQFVEELLEIDVDSLQLSSEATNIFMDSCDPLQHGFSNSIHCLIRVPMFRRNNKMVITPEKLTSGAAGLGIICTIAGNTLLKGRNSWTMSPHEFNSFINSWQFGTAATNGELIPVISEPTTGGYRHCDGMALPEHLSKFNALKEILGKMAEFAPSDCEITIRSTASFDFSNSLLGEKRYTREQVRGGHATLLRTLDRIVAGSLPDDENPFRNLGRTEALTEEETDIAAAADKARRLQKKLDLAAEVFELDAEMLLMWVKAQMFSNSTCHAQIAEAVAAIFLPKASIFHQPMGCRRPKARAPQPKPTTKCNMESRSSGQALGNQNPKSEEQVKLEGEQLLAIGDICENPKSELDQTVLKADGVCVEDSEHWRSSQFTHPNWKRCSTYLSQIRDKDAQVDKKDINSVLDALEWAGEITDKWWIAEDGDPSWSSSTNMKTHQRLASTLSTIMFGDRMGEGLHWDDMPSLMLACLSDGHKAAFKEQSVLGHNSSYLGPKTGYVGENRPSAEPAALQILTDFWNSMVAGRALNFPYRRVPKLVEDGVPFAPLSAVEKTNDRLELVYNPETGIQEYRPIHDHTDAQHPKARNSGTVSSRFPLQLGTNDQAIAAMCILEKKLNPGYMLRAKSKDVRKAYTIVSDRLKQVGGRAATLKGIANVKLRLTFGGNDSPGGFETLGSATSESTHAALWENGVIDGECIPRHARCTDDFLLTAVARGDRLSKFDAAVTDSMDSFAGRTSNNDDKEKLSGGWTNYQHCFGRLLDCDWGGLSSPLSRACRLEDKMVPYLEGDGTLDAADVQPLGGTAYSVLLMAPMLMSLVLPRVHAMLSHMARLWPEGSCPPSFKPSPAIGKGESTTEAREMMHTCTSVMWRLLTVDNAKHLRKKFESVLDALYRDTFPGAEKPESQSFYEMDGSGKGMMFFDPQEGGFIRRLFTEELEEALFDYSRSDGGILITNIESLPAAIGVPLVAFLNKHITRATLLNDNQNFVDAINSHCAANAKNLESLMFLSIFSFISGIDIDARYVRSEDNDIGDAGSRPDLEPELARLLDEWEKSHEPKTTHPIFVPPEVEDISTWTKDPTLVSVSERVQSVWKKVLALLEFYELNGWSDRLIMPIETIRTCIQDALDGRPIPRLDRSQEDFPAQSGPSAARKQLTGKRTETRTTLQSKLDKKKVQPQTILRQAGLDPSNQHSSAIQEAFNLLLQEQSDRRQCLWEPSLTYRGSKHTTPPDPAEQVPTSSSSSAVEHLVSLLGNNSPVVVGECCGGNASFMKAARDSQVAKPALIAEINPRHHPVYRAQFKDCMVLHDNADVTPKVINEMRLEGIAAGWPCQTHSAGNAHRTGNKEETGCGRDFENSGIMISQAHDGVGLAFGIMENVTGVKQRSRGMPKSPYKALLDNAPGFTDALKGQDVEASKVKSPITGGVAAAHHKRTIAVLLNSACFPADATIELEQGVAPSAWHHLTDRSEDTPGRFVMPMGDLNDVNFDHKVSGGVSYVCTINNPPPGHGNGDFPSYATDPKNGHCPTFTGAGAKWIVVEFNGRAVLALVNNSEAARNYLLRGLPDDWLEPGSEFGRFVISHAVLQNVADAVMVAVLTLYLTPMNLTDSKLKGYTHRVTPRDVYLDLISQQHEPTVPMVSRRSQGTRADAEVHGNRAGAAKRRQIIEAIAQQRHRANTTATPTTAPSTTAPPTTAPSTTAPQFRGQVRYQSKACITKILQIANTAEPTHAPTTNDATVTTTATRLAAPQRKNQVKPPTNRGRRRKEVVMTEGVDDQIDLTLGKRKLLKAKVRHDNNTRHFISFFEGNNWCSLIEDPFDVESQRRLLRWMAFEIGVKQIKGSSLKGKFPSIDKYHTSNGKLPPCKLSPAVQDYINELLMADKPVQPRLPVPPQIIDVHELENASEETVDECDALATGHSWALRSIEYLGQSQRKISTKAVHWRDFFPKINRKVVTGEDVAQSTKVTMSISSTKNSARRCTRSVPVVGHVRSNGPKRICDRYLRIFRATGSPPNPDEPIFLLPSGKLLTRARISSIIQQILVSVGVPANLVGSHSLRRGSISCYKAAGASDADCRRFGRWTSDAYLLYIHVESEAMDGWVKKAAVNMPHFELN